MVQSKSEKDPIIELSGKIIKEIRVHPNELNFTEFDNFGNFLLIGGRDFGKMFLCDTQPKFKTLQLSPVPQNLGKKKKKFQPSFDSPSSKKSSETEIESQPIKDPDDDGKYFKICHWVRFEGKLLDLSFSQKTVVALVSTPVDEPGSVNDSETIKNTGDQVAIFTVDKNAKTIEPMTIVFTKGRCSGSFLSFHKCNGNVHKFCNITEIKRTYCKANLLPANLHFLNQTK